MKKILIALLYIISSVHAQTLQPATSGSFLPGINYSYSEVSLSVLPTSWPAAVDTVLNFTSSVAKRAENYAINYTGFVNVPADGTYTFYITSDDGSKLLIDNILVVNNDGLHAAIEKSGTIGLKAGKHAINVQYFQATGGSTLGVKYSGSTIVKQAIPDKELFRLPTIVLKQPAAVTRDDVDSMINVATGFIYKNLALKDAAISWLRTGKTADSLATAGKIKSLSDTLAAYKKDCKTLSDSLAFYRKQYNDLPALGLDPADFEIKQGILKIIRYGPALSGSGAVLFNGPTIYSTPHMSNLLYTGPTYHSQSFPSNLETFTPIYNYK